MKANVTTSAEFDKVCAKKGKSANCCTVPVVRDDLSLLFHRVKQFGWLKKKNME